MQFSEYQAFCPETFIYNSNGDHMIDVNHMTHGLGSEAGEVLGAYQKFYRGDYDETELLDRVSKEIGGLMYSIAMLCNLEGLDLDLIASTNMSILKSRKERGVIQGDDDENGNRIPATAVREGIGEA